jgi:hypothetical protein
MNNAPLTATPDASRALAMRSRVSGAPSDSILSSTLLDTRLATWSSTPADEDEGADEEEDEGADGSSSTASRLEADTAAESVREMIKSDALQVGGTHSAQEKMNHQSTNKISDIVIAMCPKAHLCMPCPTSADAVRMPPDTTVAPRCSPAATLRPTLAHRSEAW